MSQILQTQVIGVDIGNSGLRVCLLDTENGDIEALVRLRWKYSNQCSQLWNNPARERFLPSERAWLATFEQEGDLLRILNDTKLTWLISSVRRDASRVLIDWLERRSCIFRLVVANEIPMELKIERTEQVGIDRLLAAYAADEYVEKFSGADAAIVIQAGSAVTVDLITQNEGSKSSFEGGAIVPGVPMMLRLLGQAADMLPELDADDLIDLPELPGRDTEQAMLCGTSSALIGGVLHLVGRYREQSESPLPVILSGGDGTRVAPYIPKPMIEVRDLVSHGLLRLARWSRRIE